jgi:hypothetical protein
MLESIATSLLYLALAQPAVHRCVGADGVVRFQDRPCAEGEVAREIDLRPEPEPVASSTGAKPTGPDPAVAGAVLGLVRPVAAEPESGPSSWRCEVSNGEVYFRHDGCPAQISELVALVSATGEPFATVLSHRVQGVRVSRRLACREINRGARFGAERDQRAEPYDKLSGRDPCR